MLEPLTGPCEECGSEFAVDRDLRFELACGDEPIVYCVACW